MRSTLILFAVCACIASCGGGSGQPEPSASPTKEQVMAGAERSIPASNVAVTPVPAFDRKIIRTGELRFQVKDPDVAHASVVTRVAELGGYVEGDDRSDLGHALTLTVRVRVPSGRFDELVAGLNDLGELEYRSVNASDVTAEWVDVEARLKAKREVEGRYLEIVKQAKSVTEILEVERELGNVRAEIESMEGRMKTLHDQVEMSTLTVVCVKPRAGNDGLGPGFGIALREGWNNLVRVLVAVLHIWPFLLVAGVVLWSVVRRDRARRKQRS